MTPPRVPPFRANHRSKKKTNRDWEKEKQGGDFNLMSTNGSTVGFGVFGFKEKGRFLEFLQPRLCGSFGPTPVT